MSTRGAGRFVSGLAQGRQHDINYKSVKVIKFPGGNAEIKELIKVLDFGNIIICRKYGGETTAKNLMQLDEIDKVLDELGYPVDIIPDIGALI
ncbi:MAG: hypothetical protein LBF63_08965 [Treponema sp.]|jgi:hypothetical protein|nr:hypothetical protein [Treponema sp.]